LLSCSIAFLAAGLVVSPARAQDAYPPPSPDGFQRRRQLGAQIGGSGVLQAVYRYRAAGPLHLEVGALAADHGGNLSAGFVIGAPVANRWFPYLGFGGGWLFAFGPRTPDGCDAKTTDCPLVTDSDTYLVVHARAGIGVALGAARRHLLSVDAGAWWGVHHASRTDAAGVETRSSARVLRPMAGLAYFYAF
jgi:hypothetical protein